MSHISFFLQADACFQKPPAIRRYRADGVMSHDERLDRDKESGTHRDPAVIREEARVNPANPNDPLRTSHDAKARDDLRTRDELGGRSDLNKDLRVNDIRTAPPCEYVINEYYRFDKGVNRLSAAGDLLGSVNTDRVDDAIIKQHPNEYAAFKAYVVKNEEKLFTEARKVPGTGYYFDYSGKPANVALSKAELSAKLKADRDAHAGLAGRDPDSRIARSEPYPNAEHPVHPGIQPMESFDTNLKKDKNY